MSKHGRIRFPIPPKGSLRSIKRQGPISVMINLAASQQCSDFIMKCNRLYKGGLGNLPRPEILKTLSYLGRGMMYVPDKTLI
jgi:hypothetical protein